MFHLIDTVEKLESCLVKLSQKETEFLAFDFETTGLDRNYDDIVGLSFSNSSEEAYYIPIRHRDSVNLDLTLVANMIRPLCESKRLIFHNAKFDRTFLQRMKIKCDKFEDTMLLAFLNDPDEAKPLGVGLKAAARRFLKHEMLTFDSLFPEIMASKMLKKAKKAAMKFNSLTSKVALPYAADDALQTWKLFEYFRPIREKFLWVYKIELKLSNSLMLMENRGYFVSEKILMEFKELAAKRKRSLEGQIFKEVGKTFNLDSPAKVAGVLYNDLNLPVKLRTPKGKPSTKEEVLDLYDHPVCKMIKEYRKIIKSEGSYVDSLLEGRHPKTGKVYFDLLQTNAPTGRLACSASFLGGINIQSTPKEMEGTPFAIRKAFTAPEGYTFVSIDFSNVELRVAANLSGEKVMIKAFNEGLDYHSYTGANIFKKDISTITKDERKMAKIGNFNLLYAFDGIAFGLRFLDSKEKGNAFYSKFYKGLPDLLRWKLRTAKEAHNSAKIRTYFGFERKLHMFDRENAGNYKMIHFGRKSAVNTSVQGCAAQIYKIAQIKVDDWIKQEKLEEFVIPVFPVHDEIDFYVKGKPGETEFHKLIENIVKRMEMKPKGWAVPILADVEVGPSWGELKSYPLKRDKVVQAEKSEVIELSITLNRSINPVLLFEVKELVSLYEKGEMKLRFIENGENLGYAKSTLQYSLDFKNKLEAIKGVVRVREIYESNGTGAVVSKISE